MKKRDYKSRQLAFWRSFALWVGAFVLVLGCVLWGLDSAGESVSSEGVRVAQDAVRKAAVSCYALEGAYPDSYEYLRENYGLQVNEELYAVHYSIFASNIMPDITVVER